MNQIFRITVGPETLQGRLPPVRVGKNYCCRFHIFGVAYTAETVPPKIWITTAGTTLFWSGTWNGTLGAWVVDVNTDASAAVGSEHYALTVYGEEATNEFMVGQGAFVVYPTIVTGGETAGGTAGESLGSRLEAIEAWMASFETLPAFDPATAFDIDMREQIKTITEKLNGSEA